MTPQTEDPRVTVVIPTRDRWPLLRRALDTVLRQEEVALEVVVVDDGSSDEMPPEVRAFAGDRLRVCRHPSNRGVAAARNTGIGAARGEWIAFLDDDDLWAPRKLVDHLGSAEAAGGEWVWGAVAWLDARLDVLDVIPPPAPGGLGAVIREYNAIGTPSAVMVRRGALERVGGFDERLAVAADWDLWLRLHSAVPGAAHEAALVGYLVHPENMHLLDPDRFGSELAYLRAKHAVGGATSLGGPPMQRWQAWALRRAGRRRDAARIYLGLARGPGDPKDAARAVLSLVERRPTPARRPRTPASAAVERWLAPHREAVT